jgi:hypothetical protein
LFCGAKLLEEVETPKMSSTVCKMKETLPTGKQNPDRQGLPFCSIIIKGEPG